MIGEFLIKIAVVCILSFRRGLLTDERKITYAVIYYIFIKRKRLLVLSQVLSC